MPDAHDYAAELEQTLLDEDPETVAAILAEPVQGAGGVIVPPDDYWPKLRKIADRHNVLLIADEVQAGFGRTGRMWAVEHEGIQPDLMTTAKAIASGVPLGALIARADLLDAWPPGAHSNTFGGNPLAIAAASATLDVLQEENLPENARLRGAELLEGLREILPSTPGGDVIEVRGRGLMIGVEMKSSEAASAMHRALLAQRVICGFCGPAAQVVRFAPPLIIDAAAVTRLLEAVRSASEELGS